jgi:hypothetical protein
MHNERIGKRGEEEETSQRREYRKMDMKGERRKGSTSQHKGCWLVLAWWVWKS